MIQQTFYKDTNKVGKWKDVRGKGEDGSGKREVGRGKIGSGKDKP